jgi:hypothetical protein
MHLLVVGGHTRSIGKTSLVVDLVRAFPQAAWTAVKITQYGHGQCSLHGEPCSCTPDDGGAAIEEEQDRTGATDSSRFLVAGARRAYWLRTRQGELAEGLPLLRGALQGAENVILESNALLQFLRPALYLVVLDPRQPDFKATAKQFLDRADAFILRSKIAPLDRSEGSPEPFWGGVSPTLWEGKPAFDQPLGQPLPADLLSFVERRFFSATQPSGST